MPIKPENRHHYRTPEWKAARAAVMERAGEVRGVDKIYREACCERCGAPNHTYVERRTTHTGRTWWRSQGSIGAYTDCDKPEDRRELRLDQLSVVFVRIVLTVAHLDHDPTNNSLDNLRALCQRCHNRHDAPHRAANRAKTRAAKATAKEAAKS